MRLSSTEDLDAPVETAFAMLADLDHYAEMAKERGLRAEHRPGTPRQGLGSLWDVGFTMQNKDRQIALEVIRFDPPSLMVFAMSSSSLAGQVSCSLVALAPDRTRLTVEVEVKPLTLKTRLLVQSMHLTKGTLDQKYSARITELATDLQSRCRQA